MLPETDEQTTPDAGTPPPDDIVIELRDVHKSFGDKHVLTGVD
ncbi:MAG: ectoine/hydroxyectoine ABC transporter ATP-binding protein EhuA, partial [Bacteroidetes bacterium]